MGVEWKDRQSSAKRRQNKLKNKAEKEAAKLAESEAAGRISKPLQFQVIPRRSLLKSRHSLPGRQS